MLKAELPKRPQNSHKGDFGRLFILAGSSGMLGAALLCGRAAARAGAGLIYLGVPSRSMDQVNCATPEVITAAIDRVGDFDRLSHDFTSIALGPGLGDRRTIAEKILANLSRKRFASPIVLDADALAVYNGRPEKLPSRDLKLILTPHPGEMSRLCGLSVEEINRHRREIAGGFAHKYNCVLVIKGQRTVVADPDGKIFENRTGNPGLATAGTGDVLTGIIGALAARGLSSWSAATIGVKVHGSAGDLAAKEKGENGLIASDVIEQLPYALH
ncbi:NAD(P)H-hydrate dehydratase [candidate division WOR-1 bacterium RIFOXYA12_FULL_52_29]|uniref:ADP-dependent (S)-NAD(P)H-hydrate dehydratase n=1 Tax=candidate division WOR-1 bacterium RIFOXYC12_FULL_54_18 TaxID=1802584 RepID=A0A1F4T4M4_UNCSA|nr:MAG: NAD(P)H-hydrate dehydratase [candidate division WOR-1 bacterium RIFOXYA2_FULL_51_19]OGC17338.1 MAG: NAD(P)H-hydrate dehydratase [candidate division WOR-1 bacterium RIFOXYA12_FULL_52_29]OGC26198.1 MAG: NAD(P)H-hydrate dehydratase [candidate division WOR-1 bacterium RIFOXYB2_FULL_45_9]OGC27755.1 MAG: NAD(P)H-hydrate dehydratase [candidate division WOR-1 bacterium RIFOXYC12_FULL_54_18]OGC29954.1 MAG: NAD(P)H-hydrate dehydratase [candidate division WOR-1 bacterium RIFOXYB12_FULL_52_16]